MTSPAQTPPTVAKPVLKPVRITAGAPVFTCRFASELRPRRQPALPSPLHPAGSAHRDRLINETQISTIDLLAADEVQRRLAMSESALRLLVNSGALAAYNVGGNVRFRAADIALLETQLAEHS